METIIKATNIKCHGCANSISTKLAPLAGPVTVNVDAGTVTVSSDDAAIINDVKEKLSSMGYPEQDPTLLQTAKSYVSCAVGRIQ